MKFAFSYLFHLTSFLRLENLKEKLTVCIGWLVTRNIKNLSEISITLLRNLSKKHCGESRSSGRWSARPVPFSFFTTNWMMWFQDITRSFCSSCSKLITGRFQVSMQALGNFKYVIYNRRRWSTRHCWEETETLNMEKDEID